MRATDASTTARRAPRRRHAPRADDTTAPALPWLPRRRTLSQRHPEQQGATIADLIGGRARRLLNPAVNERPKVSRRPRSAHARHPRHHARRPQVAAPYRVEHLFAACSSPMSLSTAPCAASWAKDRVPQVRSPHIRARPPARHINVAFAPRTTLVSTPHDRDTRRARIDAHRSTPHSPAYASGARPIHSPFILCVLPLLHVRTTCCELVCETRCCRHTDGAIRGTQFCHAPGMQNSLSTYHCATA